MIYFAVIKKISDSIIQLKYEENSRKSREKEDHDRKQKEEAMCKAQEEGRRPANLMHLKSKNIRRAAEKHENARIEIEQS